MLGQFKYSIHLKSGLSVGNQIKNKAGIYFDSNPAVYTNTTLNTLGLASSVLDPSLSKGTEVYPNPADDILWVELSVDDLHAGATAYLYGIDEQLIRNVALHENKQAISVADLSPGLYLIRIQSGTRVYTQKWIKH